MRQVSGLRYGENPHQPAAFYSDLSLAEHGKGGIATALLHHGKEVSSCHSAHLFTGEMDAIAAASQMQIPWCMRCVMHWGMPYHFLPVMFAVAAIMGAVRLGCIRLCDLCCCLEVLSRVVLLKLSCGCCRCPTTTTWTGMQRIQQCATSQNQAV